MAIHYYLTLFPNEALIASELAPNQFGAYMATGSKKGSAEQIIFTELTKEFGSHFDWAFARKTCVSHSDGDPKHSTYLSIYRVLENVPMDAIGKLYLATRDGRSLELTGEFVKDMGYSRDFSVYQELCPVTPVIVSKLEPIKFAAYLTDPKNKVSVPKIVFADLKALNIDDQEHTGNMGGLYDNKVDHYKNCVESITKKESKMNKTLDRSHLESFSFNSINTGIFIGNGKEVIFFRFPTIDEIKKIDYDWGRSALIL